jgi:hypothetical protein
MIEIKFIFDTMEEAQEFLSMKSQPLKLKIKKENDGRGRSTKDFHLKCKEYHLEHPNLSYKECLQLLSQENKIKNV